MLSIILVASSLPPNPVSIIFISVGYLKKDINAAAVVISKNVNGFLLFLISISFKISIKSSFDIISPFIRILL